ncbi:MAG: DUF4129 domain-containing protein, partial [Candidatus Tectomicrobia bacterium]|nr:DUF4129 domain-containing protein [Candidatus Tectomicrobia bacterium]
GDAASKGFLLVPALPTPLYITMAVVVLACVSITLLNSFLRRRQPREPETRRQTDATPAPWYAPLIPITGIALVAVMMMWLLRRGSPLQQWLQRWRQELQGLRDAFKTAPQDLIEQIQSPVAGYALFMAVIVIYGGLAVLGLWLLFDRQGRLAAQPDAEPPQARRLRRAVTAGLNALQQHDDPRLAIIACYARLEHLLEDHGVPADTTLTPQEYMGAALHGLDVTSDTLADALANLVQLFELARYSLHPLNDEAKQSAAAYLETIKSHLEWEAALASRT